MSTRSFLLLIRGEPDLATGSLEQIVSEYSAWADRLASDGSLLSAEKCKDEPGRWLRSPGRSGDGDQQTQSDIGGYFLIKASDYDAAEAIAVTSPYIKYGGTIELREIDPVRES